jgi:prepilin-type processing-associated H-X9-DG protein
MYADENGGKFPDGLARLLLTQDLTSEVFICSSSQGERALGETREEQAANLKPPLHLTYVYAGKGLDASAPSEAILAYEFIENHNKDGMNFLYADGHVEFQRREDAEYFVAEIAAGHNPPRVSAAATRPAGSGTP